jgi:hypothetical protein
MKLMGYSKDLTVDEWGLALEEGAGGALLLGSGPLARVHILGNEIEAQVLKDVLEHEGIDAIIQSYRDLAFDGLFIPQRGWGCILTRFEDSKRAVEAIQAALAAVNGEPGTETP